MTLLRSSILLGLLAFGVTACGDGVPPAGNYATVQGRVTDASTGAPLAAASISINGVQYARSNAQGDYTITTVPTGPWSWAAQADGYISGGSDSPPPLTPGEKRTFSISLKHA